MITEDILFEVLLAHCLRNNLVFSVYPPQMKTLAAALNARVAAEGGNAPTARQTPTSEADRPRPEVIIEAALILESAAVALESSIKGMSSVGEKLVMAEAAQRIRVAKSHIL